MSEVANQLDEWELVRLADHTTVKARLGWKGLKAEEYVEDGYIFLATPNLKANQIDFENVNYISKWRYDESPEIQLQEGDVLIVKDGSTLGISNFVRRLPRPTTVNGSIAVVRTRSSLHSEFLYHLVNGNAFQKLIELKKAGLGVPHLFQADLREFFVSLPPKAQQRKIARILTTVDNLIEKTEALIAKYQAIKQGMMHDLFTRGVDEHGHLRPPYEEAPELYKQSELGWIPKEWETKRLNDAIRIIDCKHYTPMFRQEGVAFIRPRNVKVDGLDFSDVEYVSAEDYRLLTDKHVPHKGDIVFSRNASFGVPCYIDHDRSFAIGQDTVVMTETKANTKYIFYALLSAPTEMQVRRASTGSTFGRINLAFIRDLRIPLPPRGETSQIAKILDNLVARSKIEASSAEKLSIIKLGLMQDLLTGKVRVQVDEADEVGHDGGI
jgi:type I restriction enzyme S subunit